MTNKHDDWDVLKVEIIKEQLTAPMYRFRFSFGVFDMGIHYTRSIPPFGDNEEYWKSGVYRNGQIAFETDVNDAIPSRQSIVVNAYRPHSRAVDIYRKWFYLKNLILKSKKD